MSKVLIILGHSRDDSLCAALARAFQEGAQAAKKENRMIELGKLSFDPILHHGFRETQELEPDLVHAQESILWADHLVFVYPVWWGVPPALLKGFIDRVFLPGFAFDYEPNKPLPKKLLSGRSAHLLVTIDSPRWYYRFFIGSPGHKMMKHSVLKFCGIKPVKVTSFNMVRKSSEEKRKRWLQQARSIGGQT